MNRRSVFTLSFTLGMVLLVYDSSTQAQFRRPPSRGITGIRGGTPSSGFRGISGGSFQGRIPSSGFRGISGRGISGGFSGISGRRPGSMFQWTWSCSKCGAKAGRSSSYSDRPSSCPSCGVRFINGGIGSSRPGSTFRPEQGNPARGWDTRRNNPPRNPVRQPDRNNENEEKIAARRRPDSRPRIPQNPFIPVGSSTPQTTSSSSEKEEKSNVLPLILIGVSFMVVLGSVAFLLISLNKKKKSAEGRSRPARRRQSMDRYLSQSRD